MTDDSTSDAAAPIAGWYQDPNNPSIQRYWDGAPGGPQQTPAPPAAFCRACGRQLDARAVVCPHCGVAQAGVGQVVLSPGLQPLGQPSRKEPALAILFSFIFAGAGELYAGDSGGKTITLLVVAAVAWVCALTLVLIPIALLLGPAFIYSMVNASKLVKAHNLRHGYG
jgi:uncharacterized protein DUF2510